MYSHKRTAYSLKPGIYEVTDINKTPEYISPDDVKVSVIIDDFRLKSNLKKIKLYFSLKSIFFYTILDFTQSHSYLLDDIDGFCQLIAGSYKSNKPIKITGIDKILFKCNCINSIIVNGSRKPILYSLTLSSPPGH